MLISYDAYRVFYTVARLGSFTKAAGALLSSQPNLTRTIRNLESALGCTLFVRSNRGAVLTPEGEKLFARVAVACEQIQAGEEELASDRSLQSGVVSIGASETALHGFLLPVLGAFHRAHPGIRLRIANHSTPQAFSALRSGDALDLTSEQLTGSSADEYAVMVLDTEGYADLTGEQVTLAPGEALAWTDGAAFGDTLTLGGDTLRLRQLDSFSLVSGSSIMGLHTLYLVVPDLNSVLELRAQQNAYTSEHGGTRSMLNYTYQFDLSGTDDEQLDALHALLCDPGFESAAEAANVNYTTDMRADGYPTLRSTYGGFLFLGFFLGFVFLFATVLIIYYKQVSEGYDDRGRFRIMQQVGMTPKEVKATIRTQVLLMFFLPLVTAAIHIAFAFPLIKQIVFAFGLQNVHLFLLCTLGTFGVFALLYTFVYLLTVRTYYRIVRMTD